MKKARVYFVDDHPLVREWLSTLINDQPDLTVCGNAAGAPEALRGVREREPDIVLVDLSLERGSGLELIKDVHHQFPSLPIVVLTMHDENLYAERCLRAGARGYVTKRETATSVIAAIHCVLKGDLFISEAMRTRLAEHCLRRRDADTSEPVTLLSDRELEVFELMGSGHSTRKIAQLMGVSMKTVQAHCAHIKEKLNLADASELLREAVRWHEQNI